jgi:PAS domain S-box-containing protein
VNDAPASDRLDSLDRWTRAAHEVTDVLASARGLPEAAPGILRALGEGLECDGGAFWVHDPARDTLECVRAWRREGGTAPARAGTPLPVPACPAPPGPLGIAWSVRRPAWAHDVGARDRAGDGGAVAIPIVHGDVAYGVLELFRSEPLPADEPDRLAAETLGKQVGQFAAREGALRDLVRSRRELADLFENAPVGLHVMDRDGRILRVNRAELFLLGYSREELVGRLWRDLHVDPGEADRWLARMTEEGEGDLPPPEEARIRCRDGSVKRVQVDGNVLRDRGRVEVRTYVRDVTARREAESALRASEERLRRLVEGAREYALHALDVEGRVTSWNSGARRLYGYDESEVLGRDFAVSFEDEDRAEGLPARVVRIAVDEGEYRHEGWRLRRDGSRFWAEVFYAAIRDTDGRVTEVSQLTRDLAERRWTEALRRKSADLDARNREVAEAGRRNAELLRAAADAIAGPAAEIESAADRLHESAGTDTPDLRALAAGIGALKEAVRGLEGVGAVSPTGGEEAVAVDLLRAAADTRDLLRDAAVERRIRVETSVDPALGDVVADPVRVRQVLYNLLSNAIKFSHDRGRVALRILPEGEERFRIEVEDGGVGIAPEEVDRVFQGRPPGAEPGSAPGGLGLPVTKRIVEEQGGRVGVQSTLGRGSVFFAVLPRSPLAGARLADAGTHAPYIVVVSEDSATRAGVAWSLGHAGCEVTAEGRPESALAELRERAADAVAVDLRLSSGAVDLVATLRTSGGASRDVRWILAAAGTDRGGAACLAVNDVLPRPAPADRLLAAFERARVPRGGTVLVAEGDADTARMTTRTAAVLGYEAVEDGDGDSALRRCAERPPAVVVLGPSLRGLDPFEFLRHLHASPDLAEVPVVLLAPRGPEDEALLPLLEAAPGAARDRSWARFVRERCAAARTEG